MEGEEGGGSVALLRQEQEAARSTASLNARLSPRTPPRRTYYSVFLYMDLNGMIKKMWRGHSEDGMRSWDT